MKLSLKVNGVREEGTGDLLVPLDDPNPLLPKLTPLVPANSFYRISAKTKRVAAIVTMLPGYRWDDEWACAWDTCAECLKVVRKCRCPKGIAPSKWVQDAAAAEPVIKKPEPKTKPRTTLRRKKARDAGTQRTGNGRLRKKSDAVSHGS